MSDFNKAVDDAIQKFTEMSPEEFGAYKPLTVGETLAMSLIVQASDQQDYNRTSALRIILERMGGRVGQRNATEKVENELLKKMKDAGLWQE